VLEEEEGVDREGPSESVARRPDHKKEAGQKCRERGKRLVVGGTLSSGTKKGSSREVKGEEPVQGSARTVRRGPEGEAGRKRRATDGGGAKNKTLA